MSHHELNSIFNLCPLSSMLTDRLSCHLSGHGSKMCGLIVTIFFAQVRSHKPLSNISGDGGLDGGLEPITISKSRKSCQTNNRPMSPVYGVLAYDIKSEG